MALHFPILVNGYVAGTFEAVRIAGEPHPDSICTYRVEIIQNKTESTPRKAECFGVYHRYGDGAFALIQKAISETAMFRSGRHSVEEVDGLRIENTRLLAIVDRYRKERDAEREKVAGLTEELRGYREEKGQDEEWNRRLAVDNVRCEYCDLRYGEREQYGCTDSNNPHSYSDDELRAAREGGQ